MSELKVVKRDWTFRVELPEGEASPLQKKYTKMLFRPTSANIEVTASLTGKAGLVRAFVFGPRILKEGTGLPLSDDFSRNEAKPEWLESYIELAVSMAQVELDK